MYYSDNNAIHDSAYNIWGEKYALHTSFAWSQIQNGHDINNSFSFLEHDYDPLSGIVWE